MATLDLPFPAGRDENISEEVRAALASTIRRSARSIEQIAEGMTARLGIPVSRAMLYGYTAESHPAHRFPFEFAAAFIRETGDRSLLKVLLDGLGLPMPEPGSGDLVGFAKARIQADLAAQEADGFKARALRGGARL